MAQSIRNLALGTKVKDRLGNKFVVIAHDHYGSNEVTLITENSDSVMQVHDTDAIASVSYEMTNLATYLNGDYLNKLDSDLRNAIKLTNIPYLDVASFMSSTEKTVQTKVFVLSGKELGGQYRFSSGSSYKDVMAHSKEVAMSYMVDYGCQLYIDRCWTRTEGSISFTSKSQFFAYQYGLEDTFYGATTSLYVMPAFNLGSEILVTDSVDNGYYTIIFNEPPVIQNISNIEGNYGTPTTINYVVKDNDDSVFTHYISFDNGATYTKITPSVSGTTYTYAHVFSNLGTYYCRIKVVDSADNTITSNGFSVKINSIAPTVNIVSANDKSVTFKTNCLTHDISKVEILLNNSVVKTYTSGFNSNLTYEIDTTLLTQGKNSMQIKSISTDNLAGYASAEINKLAYNLPPTGSKVIINNNEYTIVDVLKNGSTQTYLLNNYLISDVSIGQEIKITQDNVKVLCSLTNLENSTDFKEMKLVKTKKLKGSLEGYVEEKYELEGEGRYSAIKLETERFNNTVESEIIELQQYFDYMQD